MPRPPRRVVIPSARRPLLLSPHNDDETLFASYLILRDRPHVVVCLRSMIQEQRGGPTYVEREVETGAAMGILGTTWEQWQYDDDDIDEDALRGMLETYADDPEYGTVYAPAFEEGGHPHHNLVARLAFEVFGDRVIGYYTYVRGSMRTQRGNEHRPGPGWAALKLRAMSCYRSQLNLPDCFPWFDETIREWVEG